MNRIELGSNGVIVRVWQEILGNMEITGNFDMFTKARTIEWQGLHGLKKDGIVGDKTWETALENL